MQVRVIRQFLNHRTVVHEGDILEVDERRARQLQRNNLVVPDEIGAVTGAQQMTAQREREDGAEAGAADPTDDSENGGPTGEDQPASSSRRGRRRSTPVSSEGEAEPGSSP